MIGFVGVGVMRVLVDVDVDVGVNSLGIRETKPAMFVLSVLFVVK